MCNWEVFGLKLYGALISLSLIWGLSFVFIKVLVEAGAGPWGVVFLRCLFGALILLVIILSRLKKTQHRHIPWFKLLVIGLFNAGIPWVLIALSEQRIYSSTASILNATTPIWTSVIGFLLFNIKLKRQQWLGIILGFVGILALLNFDVKTLFGDDFIGIGTMVAAAIFYGFSSQYSKKYLQEVNVLITSFGTLLVGAVCGLIGMVITQPFSLSIFQNEQVIASVIGLGVFGSGIAYLLFFYLIQKGSAEFATYVTYLVPVTAMLWGYVLLHESLSSNLYLGLFLIIAGVFLSTKKKKLKQQTSVTEPQLMK